VIVAGGRGSRFGGAKASAPFLGRAMVEWVVEAARAVAGEVIVCVAPGDRVAGLAGVLEVEDEAAFEGPLAGLVGGMRAARGEWVLALACDMPLVAAPALEVLAGRRGHDVDAVVPVVGGFEQPLVALYRRSTALPEMERARAAGERSVRGALAELRVARVPEADFRSADPGLLSFQAANTPEELRRLEAVAVAMLAREDAPNARGGNGSG